MIRIEEIVLYSVRVPLRSQFRTSTSVQDSISRLIVKLVSADKLGGSKCVGWGEAPTYADPYYVPETANSVWDVWNRYISRLLLIDFEWSHPRQVASRLIGIKGNGLARSAAEMAAWDIYSQMRGIPLAQVLNEELDLISENMGIESPSTRSQWVHGGAAIGIQGDHRQIHDLAERCIGQGYRRLKFKIAPGYGPGEISSILEQHPSIAVVADANGTYSIDDPAHMQELVLFDSLGMIAVEQPLASEELLGHARLAKILRTPIALDETIVSRGVTEAAIELGSCQAISIKPARLGGLGAALEVLALCRKHELATWCGGMHELGIGRFANVALASLDGFTLPGDLCASDFFFDQDVVVDPINIDCNGIEVPTNPGGPQVDEGALESFCTEQKTISCFEGEYS